MMTERIGVVLMAVGLFAASAHAGLTATGDVTPPDPYTWTSETYVYVGETGAGAVDITAGDGVDSSWAYFGFAPGATGDVTVDGAGSTWAASRGFTVGAEGDGSLAITNGGAATSYPGGSHSMIGWSPDATGVVTIDGAGSSWTNHGQVQIGGGGTGAMHVTNGGTMNSIWRGDIAGIGYVGGLPGATGLLNIDGAGSTWNSWSLVVGMNGGGTMNVTNGGQAISDGEGYVGMLDNSTGTATVDGVGSQWQSRKLEVGRGTLNITNGGHVDVERYVQTTDGPLSGIHFDAGTIAAGSFYAGAPQLTGAGTVDTHGLVGDVDLVFDSPDDLTQTITLNSLPGQNITVNLDIDGQGALGAGYSGSGSTTISNGVDVVSTLGAVGYDAGSTGVVTVDGAGSTWTTTGTNGWAKPDWYDGDLDVGYYGDGTLNVTGGAVVSCMESHIGHHLGSTGAVTVDGVGSTWTSAGYSNFLHVGSEGAGLLNITNGGLVSVDGELTIDYDGDGDGFINMATGGMLALYGDADDSLTEFLGIVSGTDAIRYGDIDLLGWDTAGLDYELAYQTGGDLAGYTTLTINSGWGDFDLDTDVDDIDIDLLGDAIRTGSAELWLFDISADGTTGGADGVIDKLDLDYLVRFLVETAIGNGTEYGDWNLDGKVDTTDLTRLATNYGNADWNWDDGNANRHIDTNIDNTDLTILATYYGFGTGPDAIPEPATLSLLALGGLAVLRRRKRT